MHRIVMIGAALVFAVALSASAPAQPWEREAQMHALYLACQQGNIVACIKFGVRIGEDRERRAEWRRIHHEWFWWESD